MMEMRSQPSTVYDSIIMGDTNICPLTERLVPRKEIYRGIDGNL